MSIHHYTFGPPAKGWPKFDERGRIMKDEERVAVFVVGPESSGTRLLTRFFIEGGFYGADLHTQSLDRMNFADAPAKIVFRRSLPHANRWPDLVDIYNRLERGGYERIHIVFTFRDPIYMVQSQVRAGHVPTQEAALDNIATAITRAWEAFSIIGEEPFVMLYEQLIASPELRDALAAVVGLEKAPELPLYNANDKYSHKAVPPSRKLEAIYVLMRTYRLS